MTLLSSRKGSTTLELHGQSVTCLPIYDLLDNFEKDVGMDFEDAIRAILFGIPVPGTEDLDEEGKPIEGTRRLKQKPRLIVPIIYHTQIGRTPRYTKVEVNEWLLGNPLVFSEEGNKEKIARFLVNMGGGDYDAMVEEAKARLEAEQPEKKDDGTDPATS